MTMKAMDGMDRFAACFVRNPDGSWFCRAPAHLVGPTGPVSTTPGTSFRRGKTLNGYDLAAILDEWADHRRPPVNIQVV